MSFDEDCNCSAVGSYRKCNLGDEKDEKQNYSTNTIGQLGTYAGGL
jgi:hypothetical protein